jgi:hypothetical protein
LLPPAALMSRTRTVTFMISRGHPAPGNS